jgi:uncharacterized membrane protein YjjP (DUF1212 family)
MLLGGLVLGACMVACASAVLHGLNTKKDSFPQPLGMLGIAVSGLGVGRAFDGNAAVVLVCVPIAVAISIAVVLRWRRESRTSDAAPES